MNSKLILCLVVLLGYFQFKITNAAVESDYPSLTMMEVSPGRIRGRFSTNDGEIDFDSMAATTSNDHHSFSISTTEGTNLISSAQHYPNGPVGISLFNKRFILARDQSGKMDDTNDYLVPERLHEHVDSAMKNQRMMSLLQKQFEKNPTVSREAAINRFVSSKEANLVVDAAKALGNRGIIGRDNPAAMRLYLLAMRLENLIAKKQESSNDERVHSTYSSIMAKLQNKEYCSSNKKYCEKGKCPEGNECVGMCGRTCSCWKWVCGNCCWNKMCYDHDTKCCKTMLSWKCMGIAYKRLISHCDEPYSC